MIGVVAGYVRRNAIGFLALFVALGGASYAVASTRGLVGHNGKVYSCVNSKTGAVRLIKKGVKCHKGQQSLSWNQQGPIGAQGQTGLQGTQGSPGLSLFARVDETGALYQHSPGVTVSKNSKFKGIYTVTFTQDVSGCAAVISQGEKSGNGSVPDALYEAVIDSDPYNGGNPHAVNVYAHPPGTVVGEDAGFDLILAC